MEQSRSAKVDHLGLTHTSSVSHFVRVYANILSPLTSFRTSTSRSQEQNCKKWLGRGNFFENFSILDTLQFELGTIDVSNLTRNLQESLWREGFSSKKKKKKKKKKKNKKIIVAARKER